VNRNRAGQGADSATDNGEANTSPISPQSAQVQVIPVDDVAQITRSSRSGQHHRRSGLDTERMTQNTPHAAAARD